VKNAICGLNEKGNSGIKIFYSTYNYVRITIDSSKNKLFLSF